MYVNPSVVFLFFVSLCTRHVPGSSSDHIDEVFIAMDQNKDGSVDWAEAERHLKGMGFGGSDQHGKKFEHFVESFINTYDLNGDKIITAEEFRQDTHVVKEQPPSTRDDSGNITSSDKSSSAEYMQSSETPEVPLPEEQNDHMNTVFVQMDADKNGIVTRLEAQEYLKSAGFDDLGNDPGRAAQFNQFFSSFFNTYDHNKDNIITAEEFKQESPGPQEPTPSDGGENRNKASSDKSSPAENTQSTQSIPANRQTDEPEVKSSEESSDHMITIFTQMDADKNGIVTRIETQEYLKSSGFDAFGNDPDRAEQFNHFVSSFFNTYDHNEDNIITAEEFKQNMPGPDGQSVNTGSEAAEVIGEKSPAGENKERTKREEL